MEATTRVAAADVTTYMYALRSLRTKEVEGVDCDGRQANEQELGSSLRRATGERFGTTHMSLQGK